jgi:lactoylglutathione lyase
MSTGSKTLFDAAMELQAFGTPNLRQAVPFFNVKDIEESLRFYVERLAFTITRQWTPGGRIRWCWLERDGVAIMLQEYWKNGEPGGYPEGVLGQGVTICFVCADAIALYHDVKARGLNPSRPFVGNNLWVTSLTDPDGYRLDFESPTDVPEDTVYSDPA